MAKVNTEQNSGYFSYVLTLAMLLFLVGISLLFWLQTSQINSRLSGKSPDIIELSRNYPADSLKLLQSWLQARSDISSGSIQFVGKEKALQEMSAELPPELIEAGENPFLDLLLYQSVSPEASAQIKKDINEHFGHPTWWTNVSPSDRLPASSGELLGKLSRIGFLSFILFGLICGLIMWYLSGVYVKDRSQVITALVNMGAQRETILSPYRKRSLIFGLASALIAIGCIGLILLVLTTTFKWFSELFELNNFLITLFVLLLAGPVIHSFFVKLHIQKFIQT